MSYRKSPPTVLAGLGLAAAAFGAAAMMSAAVAPAARADAFSDIIASVNGDFTDAQTAFSAAFADFAANHVNNGVAALFDGVDEDFFSAPDNLYVGTLDALSNVPVVGSLGVSLPPESDFATALTEAESFFTGAQTDLAEAATALSAGDFAEAAYLQSVGSLTEIASGQVLLEGVLASF